MKRRSDSSGNAAMRALKSLKSFQRVRIADHACDLPALGRIGGLALCAGLGLWHSGANRRAQGNEAGLFLPQLGGIGWTPYGAEAVGASSAQVDGAEAAVLGEGKRALHGLLRLVTVGPSYTVTSDAATTVRREVVRKAA